MLKDNDNEAVILRVGERQHFFAVENTDTIILPVLDSVKQPLKCHCPR